MALSGNELNSVLLFLLLAANLLASSSTGAFFFLQRQVRPTLSSCPTTARRTTAAARTTVGVAPVVLVRSNRLHPFRGTRCDSSSINYHDFNNSNNRNVAEQQEAPPVQGSSYAHPEEEEQEEVIQLVRLLRRRIAGLMDEAFLLLVHEQQQQQQQQSNNPVWLTGQVDSLMAHLLSRWQTLLLFTGAAAPVVDDDIAPCSSISSSQRIAQAIDAALLRQAPLEEVSALVHDFERACCGSRRNQQHLDGNALHRELDEMQRQIAAFRESVSRSISATTSTVESTPSSLSPTESTVSSTASTLSSNRSERDGITTEEEAFQTNDHDSNNDDDDTVVVVDVAIVGAGLGGLCAGAILNTLYGKTVGVYESHDAAGGCAHAFQRRAKDGTTTFTFDSGPTILLGSSSPPYNGLQQVLQAVGQPVEWIPYRGWGMIENPGRDSELRWRVELGATEFIDGPLRQFGGNAAVREFRALQQATKSLTVGVQIPALAMRGGTSALVPLLRYFPTLVDLIKEGKTLTGTFAPFMDGPLYKVTSPWLRNWLDALAFSLSGLPASRTGAAAMGFILNDMHRKGATLDYPKGGMGEIVAALVRGVEQGDNGSKVHLRQHVESIDCDKNAVTINGITLRKGGKKIRARDGVICNAPVWMLRDLIKDARVKQKLNNNNIPMSGDASSSGRELPSSWTTTTAGASISLTRPLSDKEDGATAGLLHKCDTAEMTGSFLHLHLAINAQGLDLDDLEAHYTVMDRSLAGDGSVVNGVPDGPCGEGNMIAVSNPCKLDRTLAPDGYIVLHAYMAGNEPYERWESLPRSAQQQYQQLKDERAAPLWRAVESIVPDVRARTVLQMIGSPLTHERFLRRPRGTYGAATEDYLKDGSTPYSSLVLASDSVFPGIGVPSVAIAGASAANSLVGVWEHWQTLGELEKQGKLRTVK